MPPAATRAGAGTSPRDGATATSLETLLRRSPKRRRLPRGAGTAPAAMSVPTPRSWLPAGRRRHACACEGPWSRRRAEMCRPADRTADGIPCARRADSMAGSSHTRPPSRPASRSRPKAPSRSRRHGSGGRPTAGRAGAPASTGAPSAPPAICTNPCGTITELNNLVRRPAAAPRSAISSRLAAGRSAGRAAPAGRAAQEGMAAWART